MFGIANGKDLKACDYKLLGHDNQSDVMNAQLLVGATAVAGAKLVPNDGMVAVKDAKWGNFQGCIVADHLDEVGQPSKDGPISTWALIMCASTATWPLIWPIAATEGASIGAKCLIAATSQLDVKGGQATCVVRGQLDDHAVVDVKELGVMIELLGVRRHAVDKRDRAHEVGA